MDATPKRGFNDNPRISLNKAISFTAAANNRIGEEELEEDSISEGSSP